MKKDVLITLSDAHTVNEEKQSYEITTHGTFDGDEKNYTIEYDEQYEGMEHCHTVLNVKDGTCVSLVRTGSYESELMIELEKRHNCQYNTPFGSFLIGIYASDVMSSITDGVGTLHLKYTIDFYSDIASKNEMLITLA